MGRWRGRKLYCKVVQPRRPRSTARRKAPQNISRTSCSTGSTDSWHVTCAKTARASPSTVRRFRKSYSVSSWSTKPCRRTSSKSKARDSWWDFVSNNRLSRFSDNGAMRSTAFRSPRRVVVFFCSYLFLIDQLTIRALSWTAGRWPMGKEGSCAVTQRKTPAGQALERPPLRAWLASYSCSTRRTSRRSRVCTSPGTARASV